MSALTDAVKAVEKLPSGPRCTVGTFIRTNKHGPELAKLLAGDTMSTQISDALATLQPPVMIGHGTLQRHRRGRCLCGRTR